MSPVVAVRWDGVMGEWRVPAEAGPVDPPAAAWDYSDSNPPWAYPADPVEREALFTAGWPQEVKDGIVDLVGTGNLRSKLDTTLAPVSGHAVVRLPDLQGQDLTDLLKADPNAPDTFAYGGYHPKLLGFLGHGADRSWIELKPNSMSQAQLNLLGTLDPNAFTPSHLGSFLLQPHLRDDTYLAGVGFRAHDQPWLPTVHPNLAAKGVTPNQPAPHAGLEIGSGKNFTIGYCAFVGFGRAIYPAPPFEHPNINSQYADGVIHHTDLDGRRHPDIDPAQPRRCTVYLGNNEDSSTVRRSWLHDTPLSRYAVNDQNRNTTGTYLVEESKIERIGNGAVDPALNGGQPLGSASAAVSLGYESSQATIIMRDCIVSVDNDFFRSRNLWGAPQHVGFSNVTPATNRAGVAYFYGGEWRNTAYPEVDGFLCIRIYSDNAWWTTGVANTLFVYEYEGGPRKAPWHYTGTWPPTTGQIATAGVTPQTHYIVRTTGN